MLCLYLIYKRNRNNNIKEKIIAEQFCTIIRFGFSSSKKAKTFFFCYKLFILHTKRCESPEGV